jgi:hypothetical protein
VKGLERAAEREGQLSSLNYPEKQLQAKFKHAEDFGVTGNWNASAGKDFQQALEKFAKDPSNVLKSGTYHGEPATLIYNETTGVCEVLRPDGTFWTGWKLGAEQLRNVVERGTLGGGG